MKNKALSDQLDKDFKELAKFMSGAAFKKLDGAKRSLYSQQHFEMRRLMDTLAKLEGDGDD